MKKILFGMFVVFVGLTLISSSAFAATDCVETSIVGNNICTKNNENELKKVSKDDIEKNKITVDGQTYFNCSCDSQDGSSVTHILRLVVDIMSIGVGILGVVGISIVGIQYLTAGGNEEQTRKAKRRMIEIIIGLAAYALIYALLKWLVPGFSY